MALVRKNDVPPRDYLTITRLSAFGKCFMYWPDLICFVHLSYILWFPHGTCYQMGLEHPVSCIWCLTSCSGHLEKKIDSTYYLNGLISLGKHLWNLTSEDGHCYQHWTFSSMLQQGIWNNRNYRIPLYNNIHHLYISS